MKFSEDWIPECVPRGGEWGASLGDPARRYERQWVNFLFHRLYTLSPRRDSGGDRAGGLLSRFSRKSESLLEGWF